MRKSELIQSANMKEIAAVMAQRWLELEDEEAQEECLEAIYTSLATTAPVPENFALMSQEAKAQHEVDVDMLLITIDFPDFKHRLFDKGEIETYFWDLVPCKDSKKNKRIYRALFNNS